MENYLAQAGSWVTIIEGLIFVICVLTFREGIVGVIAPYAMGWHARSDPLPDEAELEEAPPAKIRKAAGEGYRSAAPAQGARLNRVVERPGLGPGPARFQVPPGIPTPPGDGLPGE